MHLKNVFWTMTAILSQRQCVNEIGPCPINISEDNRYKQVSMGITMFTVGCFYLLSAIKMEDPIFTNGFHPLCCLYQSCSTVSYLTFTMIPGWVYKFPASHGNILGEKKCGQICWAPFQCQDYFSRYRDSHCKDKIVS